MGSDVSPPLLPDRIWHHRVHEGLGERLFFWRLEFENGYPRDSARAGLKAALAQCGVRSVAVYEMLGVHDVLVRVWLPADRHPSAFDAKLAKELKPHGLGKHEVFAVDYEVCHWGFGRDGTREEPLKRDVRTLVRDRERLKNLDAMEVIPPGEADSLTSDCLISLPRFDDVERPGIKFAIVVSDDSNTTESNEVLASAEGRLDSFENGPVELEQMVTAVVGDAATIAHRSLYAGWGFGRFLILGRVDYDEFHDVNSKLVRQLTAAPVRERFGATTTTLVSAQRGLQLFSESLTSCPFVARPPANTPVRRSHARASCRASDLPTTDSRSSRHWARAAMAWSIASAITASARSSVR